ncbi:phage tail protein [Rubrivivax sp. RP6-9]|uniref:phage tail protein n=1 Tax=Rubrivivax sp. RP6-9 TaxID=3415750 RepID=UPI003CC65121
MANTGFVVNTHRLDPYKNFKFRLLWDGRAVLGVSKVGALKRTTEVVKHRSGGDNSFDHKSPGRTSYEPVMLERGITHDLEFERWANRVHTYQGDTSMDLVNYKKDLTLEVMNERGQVAIRYFMYRCWVSEFTAMPDLDANANAVAIENMKIEMEGFLRDEATAEPAEG